MEDDAAGRSFDRHARAGDLLVLLISFGAFFVTSPLVVWDTGLFSQLCPLFSDQRFLDGMYGSFFLALLGLALAGTVLALERGTSCLPRRFVRLGCALYAVGCALFLSCAMGAVPAGPCLGVACGLCLALGTAALASFWSLVFSRFTVRSALLHLSLACGVAGALGIAYATGFLSGLPVMFVCLVLAGLVAPLSGRYAGTAPTAPSGPPENEKADLRCDRGTSNDDLGAVPCAGLWGSMRPAVAVPCLGLFLFVYDAAARTFVYEPYSHISTWSILLGSAVLLALVVRWRQFSLTSVYRVLLPGAAALFIVLSAFPVGSVFFGFGYLVSHVLMGAIALLALASLCGVAHAGEFPSLLIGSALVAMVVIADVVGGGLSTFLAAEDELRPVLLVCAILYFVCVLVVPLGEYYRLFSGRDTERGGGGGSAPDVDAVCAALAEEAQLSGREREVLPYLARGHRPAYIAELLCISEHTVRTHIRNMYRKLGVNSTDGLIGLVEERTGGARPRL